MTDAEIEKIWGELVEHYGDQLANFEHYPRIFAHQLRLYRYYKERKDEDRSLQ
jgi:hypothetical protein